MNLPSNWPWFCDVDSTVFITESNPDSELGLSIALR